MRTPALLAVSAFFLGIALFGIFKSMALLKGNVDLSRAVGRLTVSLDETNETLKMARQELSESRLRGISMEVRVGALESKLSVKEKEAEQLLSNIVVLSGKIKALEETNEGLSIANSEFQDRALRRELEYAEVKRKLSSLPELKQAIKELKIRMREERRKKPDAVVAPQPKEVAVVAKPSQETQENEGLLKPLADGNAGFFMRDGRSTFEKMVEIRVVPMDVDMPDLEAQEPLQGLFRK